MQLRGDRFQRIGRLEEENPFINDEQRVSSHLHNMHWARRLIQYKWLVMRNLNYSLLRTPNNFVSSPQAKPLLWCRARQRRGAVHEWIRPEARTACCAWYHGQSLPVPRPWINAEPRLSTSTYQDAFPSYSCATIYFSLFTFVSYRPPQKTSYFLVLTQVILS